MTVDRPVIQNAPGLKWRPRHDGWEARWVPRGDLVAAGYDQTGSVKLWRGTAATMTEQDREFITDQCSRLQAAMLAWGRTRGVGLPAVLAPSAFDGTVRGLTRAFRNDPDSSYNKKCRLVTRKNYDNSIRPINATKLPDSEREFGDYNLSEINGRVIIRVYETWRQRGIPMSHTLMSAFRTFLGYGVALLGEEDPEGHCKRLKDILAEMRFANGKPRQQQLSSEQANLIRHMAHERGEPSIALAQAFQFECTLRQKDVIGEWLPMEEPGVSDVLDGNEKWLTGLRWEEINQNMILTHITSKRQKEISINLALAPMVIEELTRQFGGATRDRLPATGPVIVFEKTKLPYSASTFRVHWRDIADAAGVPKSVKNMDTRSGAITEGLMATGGDLDSVRLAATHGQIAMTQNYSRNQFERVEGVMKARAKHRNTPRTD